jgi:superfamily II DNA or RNA helicase
LTGTTALDVKLARSSAGLELHVRGWKDPLNRAGVEDVAAALGVPVPADQDCVVLTDLEQALAALVRGPSPLTAASWDAIEEVLEAREKARSAAWVPGLDIDDRVVWSAGVDLELAKPSPTPTALEKWTKTRAAALRRECATWTERVRGRLGYGVELAFTLVMPQHLDDLWRLSPAVILSGDALVEPVVFPRSGHSIPGDGHTIDAEPTALAKTRAEVARFLEVGKASKPGVAAYARARIELIDSLLADWAASGLRGEMAVATADLSELEDAVERLIALGFALYTPPGWEVTPVTSVSVLTGSSSGLGGDLRLTTAAKVNGRELSAEELNESLVAGSTLALIDGVWTRLASGDLERLKELQSKDGVALTPSELLSLELGEVDTRAATGWVVQALSGAWKPSEAQWVEPAVTGELRTHQKEGLAWLAWLEANELGGVLADDMGLGKTLTALSLLAHDHSGPTLVVCPTTLVTNWEREAARFTPDLRVVAHRSGPLDAGVLEDADVVVTSYGIVLREVASFRAHSWHRLVVDEAQTIKNPLSATTKAVKSIGARSKHALTGTPVENHLGDLWSLVDLVDPGLLGKHKPFLERYGPSGDGDKAALARVVAPFLLRRKKTDPGVAADLPAKFSTREDCSLSERQVSLYQAKALSMKELDSKGRMAKVLAGLTALKQICVHPDLFTKELTAESLKEGSGKLEHLRELLAEIIEEDGAALVFTQYASILGPLGEHLSEHLGQRVVTLDGSMTTRARQKAVDEFSADGGPRVMLISLKAGGTGLNLVRANHVVHLDRWWNPAVEDQASDRAWRIGQDRVVQVHNLVCPGTLEDRIESILTGKRELADEVVTSTNQALVEMTSDELADFVRLDLTQAVVQ